MIFLTFPPIPLLFCTLKKPLKFIFKKMHLEEALHCLLNIQKVDNMYKVRLEDHPFLYM